MLCLVSRRGMRLQWISTKAAFFSELFFFFPVSFTFYICIMSFISLPNQQSFFFCRSFIFLYTIKCFEQLLTNQPP